MLWLGGVVEADAGAAAGAVEAGAAAEAADVGGHSCVRLEQRLLQRRRVAPAGPGKNQPEISHLSGNFIVTYNIVIGVDNVISQQVHKSHMQKLGNPVM